jgi:hypothetical protein
MANGGDRSAARVHWLVAGRFGQRPGGDSFEVSLAGIEEALAKRLGTLRVGVPDRLGAAATREVALEVRSLRSFTLGGVVKGVPELEALLLFSERPPADREALLAEVERIAGPGRLSAACGAAYAAGEAPGSGGPAQGPAAAMDAVVGAIAGRPGGPGGPTARKVREAVEAAVYGTALDVLQARQVADLEAAWRGLRTFLGQCPPSSDMHVEVLDVEPEGLPQALRQRPADDEFQEPDAVAVVDPVGWPEILSDLADAAQEMLAPCLVAPALRLFEAGGLAELAGRLEAGGQTPEGWGAVRAAEASRWLCAAVNPVALFSEGSGAYRRTVFGSPVWALAAMLAASYRSQGSFAALVGQPGSFPAPAGWTIPEGPFKGTRAPTEAFLPIRAQQALAAQGLVALGSQRDSDRVVLAAVPMVSGAPGAAPLPAQLLTGRIVRFSRWARRQLDPAMSPADLTALFEQAAGVFLFPGMAEASRLGAEIRGEGAERVLHVAARVKGSHALVPLEIEFDLPF